MSTLLYGADGNLIYGAENRLVYGDMTPLIYLSIVTTIPEGQVYGGNWRAPVAVGFDSTTGISHSYSGGPQHTEEWTNTEELTYKHEGISYSGGTFVNWLSSFDIRKILTSDSGNLFDGIKGNDGTNDYFEIPIRAATLDFRADPWPEPLPFFYDVEAWIEDQHVFTTFWAPLKAVDSTPAYKLGAADVRTILRWTPATFNLEFLSPA